VLLVSGGHCCLVLARGIGDYELLGNTLDDSVGEAYDKVARMLELTAVNPGVHGGKLLEDLARGGDENAFPFTEPMKHRPVRV
jgi:N6-L-threonylcarbamoyladenine synthase